MCLLFWKRAASTGHEVLLRPRIPGSWGPCKDASSRGRGAQGAAGSGRCSGRCPRRCSSGASGVTTPGARALQGGSPLDAWPLFPTELPRPPFQAEASTPISLDLVTSSCLRPETRPPPRAGLFSSRPNRIRGRHLSLSSSSLLSPLPHASRSAFFFSPPPVGRQIVHSYCFAFFFLP